MTDHLFDTFVRDKLADHASPVPGGLWEKIEAATAEKEKKKGFALIPRAYRVAALLILCASASALLFWPKQTTEKTDVAKQQQADHKNNSATSITHDNNNNTHAGTHADSTGNAATLSAVTGATTNEQTTTQQEQENAAAATTSAVTATTTSSLAARQSHSRRTTVTYTSPSDSWATVTRDPATSDHHTTSADAGMQPFSFLQAEMISLKSLSSYHSTGLQQILNTQSYKLLPVIRCPTVRNSIPKDLYIEAYASPDLVLKNTSANYGGADYLARKDSSQQLRTSFTAGVRISKALTENLLIKTGFQYSQVNEHFNYRTENERKQVTVITIHKIPQAPGDTLYVRDTSTYEQIGYLQKKTYNKYKSIDIPVLFSYEWGNDQWRLAANLGAIVNIHSWYNGEILDTSYQPVSLNNKSTTGDVYKSNIGIGLYAGFSIIKPVSEKMDLFAEPYFRYNLGDMTNKGQPFNQRLHTAGLSLGIRYRLNGGQHY
jgi:opacity protein-like surface antigen